MNNGKNFRGSYKVGYPTIVINGVFVAPINGLIITGENWGYFSLLLGLGVISPLITGSRGQPWAKTPQGDHREPRLSAHHLRSLGISKKDDVGLNRVWGLLEKDGFYMGVSKNRGTPKWMDYNGKPY